MRRSRIRSHILAAFALAVLALGGPARAAGAPGDDAGGAKTLSPFFYVKGEDAAVDALPLKSTRATVRIAGVIADVTVEQVYTNEGQQPLEAVYVFPASTRAAVLRHEHDHRRADHPGPDPGAEAGPPASTSRPSARARPPRCWSSSGPTSSR